VGAKGKHIVRNIGLEGRGDGFGEHGHVHPALISRHKVSVKAEDQCSLKNKQTGKLQKIIGSVP
jgi:hypothetical protein